MLVKPSPVSVRNLPHSVAPPRLLQLLPHIQLEQSKTLCTCSSSYRDTSQGRIGRRCRIDMSTTVSVIFRTTTVLTINAILIACTTAAINASTVNAPQPLSRLCFPPASSMIKAAIVMPSMTTAKLMRNPTLRHMLQKYRSSPRHSLYRGNSTHSNLECPATCPIPGGTFVFEHRRWRPRFQCSSVPVSFKTVSKISGMPEALTVVES